MTTVHRANERLVDHRVALGGTVEASRLAGRLGRWTRGDGTLTVQLAQAIAALIDGGELRPGDRLPAERALASAISVSRGTVVAAYALLSEDELVERRQGAAPVSPVTSARRSRSVSGRPAAKGCSPLCRRASTCSAPCRRCRSWPSTSCARTHRPSTR